MSDSVLFAVVWKLTSVELLNFSSQGDTLVSYERLAIYISVVPLSTCPAHPPFPPSSYSPPPTEKYGIRFQLYVFGDRPYLPRRRSWVRVPVLLKSRTLSWLETRLPEGEIKTLELVEEEVEEKAGGDQRSRDEYR